MDYEIVETSPALADITAGEDQPWTVTAELRDEKGKPVRDPDTKEPARVTGSGWTSAAWNYYPPQAYDPESGNRWPQWEDPVGSGQMSNGPRMATAEEILPYLRDVVAEPVRQWVEQHAKS